MLPVPGAVCPRPKSRQQVLLMSCRHQSPRQALVRCRPNCQPRSLHRRPGEVLCRVLWDSEFGVSDLEFGVRVAFRAKPELKLVSLSTFV